MLTERTYLNQMLTVTIVFFFSYNGIVWETCLRLTVYAIMKRVFSPLHMSMFRPVTVLLRAFLRTFLKIPSQLKDWSILGNGVSSYHVLKISTKPEHRLCIDLAWRDTKTYYLEINLKPVFFVHCSFFLKKKEKTWKTNQILCKFVI